LSGTGDELDRLSATLNAMFGRLDDAFRRITQFTADASHELRTPVAIIRTTAEVTRRKPRTAQEYENALDRILAESERTTVLIEDLLWLARADARVEEIERHHVVLPDLVRETCLGAGVLASAAGVALSLGALRHCVVLGDCAALRRLFLAVIDNAIKYSPQGAAVDVRLELCTLSGAPAASIEVRDQGSGIPAEDLPHIFERFYRASKDRSRRIDGVGLGLSIAQAIAQRHGGEVQVESTPGHGTTARILLPVA
jgi:signal transduction histidine kinase